MQPECVVPIRPEDRESHAVKVKLSRSSRFRRARNLYVGLLDKLPRPDSQRTTINDRLDGFYNSLAEHERRINHRIQVECQKSKMTTEDSVRETEPLLTGPGSVSASRVLNLSPNIWFRCGSRQAEKIVRSEVAGLGLPRHFGFGDKIRVGLRAAIPAADSAFPVPRRLAFDGGFPLFDGHTLFVSVERPPPPPAAGASACGLVCSVAIKRGDTLVHHGGCRIGGILSIQDGNGAASLVGVTTGHALLDEFLTTCSSHPGSPEPRLDGMRRRLGDLLGNGGRQRRRVAAAAAAPRYGCTLGTSSAATLSRGVVSDQKIQQAEWEPIRDIYSINWLGGGWERAGEFRFPFTVSQPERLGLDADFALLGLPSALANKFCVGAEPPRCVTRLLMDKELTDDGLHVLVGPEDTVPATLLWGRSNLHLRGRPFPTRKIQLDQPLAIGVSGCWVVQNGGLCGMIALIYEDEPFAYMITAEKLVQDIKQTLGAQVQVSIPQGPSGNLTSDHVSAPQGPPGNLESHLVQVLTKALVPSPVDETQYFLPRGALDSILNSSAVDRCLREHMPNAHDGEICSITDYICGAETDQAPSTTSSRGARKLFTVLVLMKEPARIADFYREGLRDEHLPFRRSGVHSADFRLARDGQVPIEALESWSSLELRQFDNYQWYMLAPSFSHEKGEKALHYDLSDGTVLPVIEYGVVSSKDGRVPAVDKARIHPDHHDFHGTVNNKTDFFAVKMLYARDKKHFLSEIEIHQTIRDHPHLTTLLATFNLGSRYYAITSWADGGNLRDVWAAHPEPPEIARPLLGWFLRECLGLAQALAVIHIQSWEDGDGHRRASLYGRHGLVEPETILCFPDESTTTTTTTASGYGTLKISAFRPAHSLPEPGGPPSGPEPEPDGTTSASPNAVTGNRRTSAYRAPESDIGKGTSASRTSDIWSLGCVFLEFATWLLLGNAAVDAFRRGRAGGGYDPWLDKAEDDFFFIDSPDEHHAVVNPAVTEWIDKLRDMPDSTGPLDKLLSFIKDKMLLIDPHVRGSVMHVIEAIEEVHNQLSREDVSADPKNVTEPFKTEPLQHERPKLEPQPSVTRPIPEADGPESGRKANTDAKKHEPTTSSTEFLGRATEILLNRIMDSVVPRNANPSAQFLPQGCLDRLLSRETAKAVLLESPGQTDVDTLVDFVCSKAPKTFAILITHSDQAPALISKFYDVGFHDSMLPIMVKRDGTIQSSASQSTETAKHIFNSIGWRGRRLARHFEANQWLFLAQVFDRHKFRYEINRQARMPFLAEISEPGREGAFATVIKCIVHSGHFPRDMGPEVTFMEYEGGQHPCLARKELVRPAGWDEDKFQNFVENEVEVLQTMRNKIHSHFIYVFAHYEKEGRHFVLFPWAEGGNLREYWNSDADRPDVETQTYLRWVFAQLEGLADAVRNLHAESCRHGDLKPENILYFDGRTAKLVIADVGFAKIHHYDTILRNVTTETQAATVMYSAPELELGANQPRSRLYDIWCMGCIYLEFVIWLLYQKKGLYRFHQMIGNSGQRTAFYTIQGSPPRARVHPVVVKWVKWIEGDKRCRPGTALWDLLRLVVDRLLIPDLPTPENTHDPETAPGVFDPIPMIVVRAPALPIVPIVKDPNPAGNMAEGRRTRASANEVVEALRDILQRVESGDCELAGKLEPGETPALPEMDDYPPLARQPGPSDEQDVNSPTHVTNVAYVINHYYSEVVRVIPVGSGKIPEKRRLYGVPGGKEAPTRAT